MKNSGLVACFFVFAAVFFLVFPASLLCAKETGALLESISVTHEGKGRDTITFKLNGPHLPKMFALKGDKPRVIFDFYDTRHAASIKRVMPAGGSLVSTIRTGLHKDGQMKTRVVLDLVSAGNFGFTQDFQEKNNTLVITVFHVQAGDASVQVIPPVKKEALPVEQAPEKKGAQQVASAEVPDPAVKAKKAASSSASQLKITDITFEQDPNKGEKVLFQLTNFNPPVVFGVEEGSPSIVCDFRDAGLAEKVPAVIPANGKFVQQVRVEKDEKQSRVRAILELAPDRHYDLQQIYFKEENLYVLFVKSSDRLGAEGKGQK
jgi:hypothetical protein